MDFFSIGKQPSPRKGDILISEPFINDDQFSRSVILLCELNENGSFGVVLNKPIDVDLTTIVEGVSKNNYSISLGGPVDSNQLYFIHSDSTIPDAEKIIDNFYFGGNFDVVREKIKRGEFNAENLHFFIGYSGWESVQLKEEIEDSCWIVLSKPDLTEILNTDKSTLWKSLVAKFGGKYKSMSEYPLNPSNN